MKIHIGKRIIKSAITLFLILLIYVVLVLVDNLNGTSLDDWKAISNMYTPFFAGIAAIYATHRDRKTSINQAKIRSIGSIIGGYFGMVILYVIEFIFLNLLNLAETNIIYLIIKFAIVSLALIPLIAITVKLKQVDAVFITCLTYLSATVSLRNGGMPVFQFATNRVLSTLIGVGVALLVNTYLFNIKKTNKNVLFVASLENNFLSKEDEMTPFVKYKLNDLYESQIPLTFATTRTPTSFEYIFSGINVNYPMITMNGACRYRLSNKRYSDVYHIDLEYRKQIDELLETCNMNAFVYTINDHILHSYHNVLVNDGEKTFYTHRKNQSAYSFVRGVLPLDLNPTLYIIVDTLDNINNFIDKANEVNLFDNVRYITYLYKKDINGKDYYYLRIFNKLARKENYVNSIMQEKQLDRLIVSASGRTDLELVKKADLSMCLDIAPSYVKENVDIVLHGDASLVVKIFDKIYHSKNVDLTIKKIKEKYKSS